MENKNYKITVLIITYNQEDVIGRALDSVLMQKKWGVYEIVISDDCSKDDTWRVIMEYKIQYPDIIRAYRNDKNLGIYGNIEKLVSLRGEGELFHILSGDDELGPGLFFETQKFIIKNKINIKDKAVCIYADFISRNTNGKDTIIQNKKVLKGGNLFSLAIRKLIFNHALIVSSKVFDKYKPIILDEGITLSEVLFDRQMQLHADFSYYIPVIGHIYYTGIGVSTMATSIDYKFGILHAYQRILELIPMKMVDKIYIRYIIHRILFSINPTVNEYVIFCSYYMISINSNYGKAFLRDLKIHLSLFKLLFRNQKNF